MVAYLHTIFTMAGRAIEIEEIGLDEQTTPVVGNTNKVNILNKENEES